MFTVLKGYNGIHTFKNDVHIELTSEDFFFHKRFNARGKADPIQMCTFYELHKVYKPSNIDELFDAANIWAVDPHSCIIRDEVTSKIKKGFRRNRDTVAQFESDWICIDVDDFPRPENIKYYDLQSQAEYFLGLLRQLDAEAFPDARNHRPQYLIKSLRKLRVRQLKKVLAK